MRHLILFVFILISLIGRAQEAKKDSVQAPVIVRDTIQVNLSNWQDQQITAFDQQMRNVVEQQHVLEESKKTLLLSILDSNKIDASKVENLQYQPGRLFLIVARPEDKAKPKAKKK